MEASRAAMVRTSVTRLISDEASRQADGFSLRTSRAVKVGRKAEPSAPAAISVKRVSLTRLAETKASTWAAGNASAIRILLTSPRTWPKRIANITVPAARAIWRLALLEVVTREDYNQSSVLRAARDNHTFI